MLNILFNIFHHVYINIHKNFFLPFIFINEVLSKITTDLFHTKLLTELTNHKKCKKNHIYSEGHKIQFSFIIL